MHKYLFIVLLLNGVLCNNKTTFSRSRFSAKRTTTSAPDAAGNKIDEVTVAPSSTSTAATTSTTETTMKTSSQLFSTKLVPLSFLTDSSCGKRKVDNHPWLAILEHSNPDNHNAKKTLSKGILINPMYVLTTVSSIHNSHPFWVVSAVRFADPISFGPEYVRLYGVPKIIHKDVDQVYIHNKKDIALIRLASPVEVTDSVRPVCLPISDSYNFRDLYLHMCKRSYGTRKDVEMLNVVPIAQSDCTTLFHRQRIQISAQEFCAWDESGDDCAGDVGTPLLSLIAGRYHVVGLTSFLDTDIDFQIDGLPGVYTRVGSHLKWITQVINITQLTAEDLDL